MGWWPLKLAKGIPKNQNWAAPAVVMLDVEAAEDEEDLHRAWRRWLQLFNTVQFMPGTLLVTSDGLAAHDYDTLPQTTAGAPPGRGPDQAALNAAWQSVIEQALESLTQGLKQLARSGATIPEVGVELVDPKGRVSADSELAWEKEKVVVLRPDQADLVEQWSSENWKVVILDTVMNLAAGIPWATATAASLGLNLNLTEEGTA